MSSLARNVKLLSEEHTAISKKVVKRKTKPYKPRPQGIMGSFKSVFIVAVEDNVG